MAGEDESPRSRLEDRVTRNENDVDRLGERFATAIQSLTASIVTLQGAQQRQETKLDHIVDLQNEAKNASGAIERLSKAIAQMNIANSMAWDKHHLDTEIKWERHKKETEEIAHKEYEGLTHRVQGYTEWRGQVDREVHEQGKSLSNWKYGMSILVGVFALIILPLAIWSYRSDGDIAANNLSTIRLSVLNLRENQDFNSDRIRAIELYNARNPEFKPATRRR